MLKVYKTVGGELVEVGTELMGEKGNWINLVTPTVTEIQEVARETGIPVELLRYPLDEEERPHIEFEENWVLVIINVPVEQTKKEIPIYGVVPLGIIITDSLIITICLEKSTVIKQFTQDRVRGFFTFKKTRFLLQILYKTAQLYLYFLRHIDRKSTEIELALQRSTENKELIKLLELEKSLVYFTTSLKANLMVMEKLLKLLEGENTAAEGNKEKILQFYSEDEDLLEDVIIENRQAIQMAEIYSTILSGMMDAFASVISNNLNVVMRFLTVVTIVLSLPTMVASFYGMNVALPFQSHPLAFWGTVIVSLTLSMGAVFIFKRKEIF